MNTRLALDIALSHALHEKCTSRAILDYCGSYYSPYYGFASELANEFMIAGEKIVAVELGVEQARFSFSLLCGMAKLVVGIDTQETARARLLAEEHPNFIYLIQPSSQVPVEVLGDKKISILHIDTEHSYGMAKMEFETYFPYLARPAFVLFDDTHAAENSVLKYVNELPYYKVIDDRLHPICGYAVVVVE